MQVVIGLKQQSRPNSGRLAFVENDEDEILVIVSQAAITDHRHHHCEPAEGSG
jgi:hypothetical protein